MKLADTNGVPVIDPRQFDGRFFFSNWTDEDFTGKWNGTEYYFPAGKTSPLLIMDEPPLNQQNIRMMFARELAMREFGKSKRYKQLDDKKQYKPALYVEKDELEPFIQKCLIPLPEGKTEAKRTTRKQVQAKAVEVMGAEEYGATSLIARAERG